MHKIIHKAVLSDFFKPYTLNVNCTMYTYGEYADLKFHPFNFSKVIIFSLLFKHNGNHITKENTHIEGKC